MRVEEILDLLNKIQGCTFAGLDTHTEVRLDGGKSNPMQGRITKRCFRHRVMLFTNRNSNGYENMVRRRLEQAGKDPNAFQLKPLKWGKRIPNSPLIEHKGKYYLQVIFLGEGEVRYFHLGKPIDKKYIAGLKEAPASIVNVRTYALESIKRIAMMREERFDVVEFPTALDGFVEDFVYEATE